MKKQGRCASLLFHVCPTYFFPGPYLALSNEGADLVPQPVLRQLGRLYRSNARRNVQMAAELARVVRGLNDADIPVLCLKGPALAVQLYGGLQRRQFNDLDILVPPEHAQVAAGVLRRLGYQELAGPIATLPARKRQRLMCSHRHATFARERRPRIPIELHWRLAEHSALSSMDPKRLWNDHGVVTFLGGRYHVLPPVELIVFLAWHGSFHRWKRLSWLFDLAQALAIAPQLDWDAVTDTAVELGVERYVALGLSLLRELRGTEIGLGSPGSSFERNPRLQRAVEISCHAMRADPTYYEHKPLSRLFWTWRLSTALRPRIRLLLEVFTPRMEEVDLIAPLGYARRWCHIGKRSWEILLSWLKDSRGVGRHQEPVESQIRW